MIKNEADVAPARIRIVLIILALVVVSAMALYLIPQAELENWYAKVLLLYLPMVLVPAGCAATGYLVINMYRLDYQSYVKRSSYDGLTHTLGEIAFRHQSQDALKQAVDEGKPVSLLLIKIDHLPAIVDSYGPPAADAVLREFGGTLIGSTREADIVGRYKNDMFVALILDTGSSYLPQVVERIQELAHADLVLADDQEIRYSISIGYCSTDDDDKPTDFDLLGLRSFSALREAEKEGDGSTRGWTADL